MLASRLLSKTDRRFSVTSICISPQCGSWTKSKVKSQHSVPFQTNVSLATDIYFYYDVSLRSSSASWAEREVNSCPRLTEQMRPTQKMRTTILWYDQSWKLICGLVNCTKAHSKCSGWEKKQENVCFKWTKQSKLWYLLGLYSSNSIIISSLFYHTW